MDSNLNSLVVIEASPKLAEIVSQGLNNPSDPHSLIRMARVSALKDAGEIPNDPQLRETHLANVEHMTTLALAGLNDSAAIAFRQQAWDMYRTGEFLKVRLPIPGTVTGEPTDKFISFTEYNQWFDFVCQQRHLDATIASATYGCVDRILPAVASGGVEHLGQAITTDDVMKIERSKLEVMMGGARKLLDDYGKTGDKANLDKLGEVIMAAQTKTKEELKKMLGRAGVRGTKVGVMDCYRVDLDSGEAAYTIIADASQQKFLEGILSGRIEVSGTTALEMMDIFGIAGGFTGTVGEVSIAEVNQWLSN